VRPGLLLGSEARRKEAIERIISARRIKQPLVLRTEEVGRCLAVVPVLSDRVAVTTA
jgi:hypothetical protein